MRTARLRLLLKERITPRSVLRFSPHLALGFTLVVVLQSVAILNQWFDSGAALLGRDRSGCDGAGLCRGFHLVAAVLRAIGNMSTCIDEAPQP